MNVHFSDPLTAEQLALLTMHLDSGIEISFADETSEAADVLVNGRPSLDQLKPQNLKALVIPWAGIPPQTRELAVQQAELAVHNIHHNASLVAEMAITLMLSAAKLTIRYDRALREHDWRLRYQANPSLSLAGKTALILGYGEIGKQVAKACESLGLEVVATRRTLSEPKAGSNISLFTHDALDDLLPQATVVIICLPLTDQTKNLLSANRLALMKPGSVLVNIGRAEIVNEAALYNALKSGKLHSAGLDVWYQYPNTEGDYPNTPPSDFPFHELDNVIMSPHRAGHSTETDALRMQHLAQKLNSLQTEGYSHHALDLTLGY
jgi:phosphoglycerate dehydrogenase-like enzyme